MATEKDKRGSRSSGKSSEDRRSGGLKMSGRFPPGTRVRLTKSAGPHQMRPGPTDEEVDAQTVDDDGTLEFSGTEPGERYFASGYVRGQPVEARLTGRADPEDAFLAGYEPIRHERQKLADGTWADEPIDRKDHDQQEVEGSTWLATDVTGLLYLGAAGATVDSGKSGEQNDFLFETVAGQALVLNLSAAVPVGGFVNHTLE
jgi:hypothetical protein